MGLDIYVRKIIKEQKREDDYFQIDDEENNIPFPEWTKPFENEIVEKRFDWEKYKEESGIDINDDYPCYRYEKLTVLYPIKVGENEYINIDLDKVPICEVKIKSLFYEEVGYQRKGLNSNFYKDYEDGKIGKFVWTKEELERYKKDYCDNELSKNNFQENIIDNFTEGEDCVTFSW